MCAWAHRETTRHLVICKSENVPRSIPRGQINSSTSVVSGKQIPQLIYAFAAWHSHVQGYSWNLPSASNPFSTFYFFSYSSYPFSFSLSLSHSCTSSFKSPPLFSPISPLFFCSCCLSFTDGVTWGHGSYAKQSSNKCRAPTMKIA